MLSKSLFSPLVPLPEELSSLQGHFLWDFAHWEPSAGEERYVPLASFIWDFAHWEPSASEEPLFPQSLCYDTSLWASVRRAFSPPDPLLWGFALSLCSKSLFSPRAIALRRRSLRAFYSRRAFVPPEPLLEEPFLPQRICSEMSLTESLMLTKSLLLPWSLLFTRACCPQISGLDLVCSVVPLLDDESKPHCFSGSCGSCSRDSDPIEQKWPEGLTILVDQTFSLRFNLNFEGLIPSRVLPHQFLYNDRTGFSRPCTVSIMAPSRQGM